MFRTCSCCFVGSWWLKFFSAIILAILLVSATGYADSPEASTSATKFIESIKPHLDLLEQYAVVVADKQNLGQFPELSQAYSQFESAVKGAWPYQVSERPRKVPAAQKALRAAQGFCTSMYRRGDASREAACDMFMKVAADFPNTPQAAKSAFAASVLFTQPRKGGVRDIRRATKILTQMLSESKSLTPAHVAAQVQLAAFKDQVDRRLEGRMDLQRQLGTWQNIGQLPEEALYPSSAEAPEDYATRIYRILVMARRHSRINARNVVTDAVRSSDPLGNLTKIERMFPDDPFIAKEVKMAKSYVMEEQFGVEKDWLESRVKAIESVPLLSANEEPSRPATAQPSSEAMDREASVADVGTPWYYIALPVLVLAIALGGVWYWRRASVRRERH